MKSSKFLQTFIFAGFFQQSVGIALAQDPATVVLTTDNTCTRASSSRPTSARSCRFDLVVEDENGDPVDNQQYFLQSRTINCTTKRTRASFRSFATKRFTDSNGRGRLGAPITACTQYRVGIDIDKNRSIDITSNVISVFFKTGSSTSSSSSSSSSRSSNSSSASSRSSSSGSTSSSGSSRSSSSDG